jgi:hypothetical protein
MKRLLLTLLFLAPLALLASIVVTYHITTKRVTGIVHSADSLNYLGTGNLINPVIPAGMETNLNAWWVTNGLIAAVPQSVLNAEFIVSSNAAIAAAAINRSNVVSKASNYPALTNDLGRILRAFAYLTLDQINLLRRSNSLPIITTNTFINALSNAVVNDPR